MDFILKFLAGIFIGIANVIPGVSGGTIAVILHAYEDLLTLTSLEIKKIRCRLKPLAGLCFGMIVGILVFAKIFTIIYEKFPIYTNFFFIGIILGSIPFLFQLVKNASAEKTGFRVFPFIAFAVTFLLMLILFIAKRKYGDMQNSVLELNFTQGVILFFVGIIGAIAMLIPGVSGSFVLLILGYYETVIRAVSNFQIPVLAIFGCGVLVGLVFGSRLLIRVLKTHGAIMYAGIFGLVLGSILQVFPVVTQTVPGYVISALCVIAGSALIFGFTEMSGNNLRAE